MELSRHGKAVPQFTFSLCCQAWNYFQFESEVFACQWSV